MGIRKTLLIASAAVIVPLAAQASPFGTNTHQGTAPAVQQGLYQEANSMKDFWDELGEGGEKSHYDCDEECGDEEGERGDRDWKRHRHEWSWRDDDDDRGNWWNESGHSGQHNWWNESGESGDHGKKKGWKKHNHHDDHGEHGENGWWDND